MSTNDYGQDLMMSDKSLIQVQATSTFKKNIRPVCQKRSQYPQRYPASY
jgi:hypothetical protein